MLASPRPGPLDRLRFVYRGRKAQWRNQAVEIRALTQGMPPDALLIDVGANKGSYLPSLSRAVPAGHVLAFEPQPLLADYLRCVLAACGFDNVSVVNAGCSDAAGTLPLAIPGNQLTSPGASFAQAVLQREPCRTVDVPVVRLDDVVAEQTLRVAAIKIDVEGHELAVLRGATQVIQQHRPVLVCECEQRHLSDCTVEDVLQHVLDMGYRGFFSDTRQLHPISKFDRAIHQRTDGDRFWDRKDYFNNFVFLP